MANFCRLCGAALPKDAVYCPQCGQPIPIEIPAPPGAEVIISDEPPIEIPAPPGAKVIISDVPPIEIPAPPGAKVVISDEPPEIPPEPPRHASAKKAAASPAPQPRKKKKKGGTRGISLFLALILVAELAVAGFKYPGFLLNKPIDLPMLRITATPAPATAVPVASVPTKSPTTAAAQATAAPIVSAAPLAEAKEIVDIDDLFPQEPTVRYTPEQIASAPAQTAQVSWWEPQADLGDVQVAFKSWNLEEEDDQLTVRTLPELSEGEDGWVIQAYDFSLASGQHTFVTDVAISIPREAGESLIGCVWYNAEKDAWQNVYFETSEDGKSYILYTDHFSILGKKTYRFDKNTLSFVEQKDGEETARFSIADGVFVLKPWASNMARAPMLRKVQIDYERLWSLYQHKTDQDIKNLKGLIQALAEDGGSAAVSKEVYDQQNALHSYLGDISAVYSAAGLISDAADWAASGIPISGSDPIGGVFERMDVLLTTLKILQEAKQGNTTMSQVIRALPAAAMNHKRDIAGVLVTTAAGALLWPWLSALAGVYWWAGNKLYDLAHDTRYAQTVEQMYQAWCSSYRARMTYGETLDADYYQKHQSSYVIRMRQPSNMEDGDFAVLSKAVARTPLKRFLKEETVEVSTWYTLYLGTAKEKKTTVCYQGWAEAFTAILSACGDEDPTYLQRVLDDFYWNYAYAFWQLDDETLDYIAYKTSGSEYGSLAELNGGQKVTQQQRSDYARAYADILKAETQPILLDVIQTMQRKSCEAMQKEMKKSVEDLFNCEIVFHVKDETLAAGKTFQDSLYCVDWQTIKQNKTYVKGGQGVRYDDSALITPMRFASVTAPRFLPLVDERVKDRLKSPESMIENYYPFTPDFIPRANKQDDVVFRCTYYHYLMMGAPTEMIFKDVSKPGKYASAKEVIGTIQLPAMTKTVSGKLKDEVTGKTTFVTAEIPFQRVDVTVVIPGQRSEVSYRFDMVTDARGPGVVYKNDRPLIEEALKNTSFVLDPSGRFTIHGSASNNYTADRYIDTAVSILEGMSDDVKDKYAWSEGSRFDYMSVDLSGTFNTSSGEGACTLTGTTSGSSIDRTGYKSGKVETDTKTYDGTLKGETNHLWTEHAEGRDYLYISFAYKKNQDGQYDYELFHDVSTTDNIYGTERENQGMELTLRFVKVETKK